MSQKIQQLEARLTRVEREIAELKAALAARPTEPWYRQIVDEYAGDKVIFVTLFGTTPRCSC